MIIAFIRNHWREFTIASLAALVIVLFNRAPAPPVEVSTERIVYKDRVVDRIVTVDRVVTVNKTRTITKPDGTKIVTETRATDKEVIKDQSHQELKETIDEKKIAVIPDPYRYSASVLVKYNDPKAVSIDVGARVIGPVSAVIGYGVKDASVRLGVRVDF